MRITKEAALRIGKEVLLWAICLFLAYVFIQAGVQKFSDSSGWSRAFRHWGFPVWFRQLIGGVETSAALLLLYRRTAGFAALMIMAVMLGAMTTHVVTGKPGQVTNEIFPLTLAAAVFMGRRKQMLWPRHAGEGLNHERIAST